MDVRPRSHWRAGNGRIFLTVGDRISGVGIAFVTSSKVMGDAKLVVPVKFTDAEGKLPDRRMRGRRHTRRIGLGGGGFGRWVCV